jgi:quercetin dioxygenase-like cupin family protein/pyrroloquinoline quinone (PQQ) biosynthesis protein C
MSGNPSVTTRAGKRGESVAALAAYKYISLTGHMTAAPGLPSVMHATHPQAEPQSPATPPSPTDPLRRFEQAHSFWNNELFAACKAGSLTKDDFAFLFGQYYLYSKNFTRYLSGLMANLDDDLLRSRLSENLWEEGGGSKPEERHAQMFRDFLTAGMGIDLESIQYTPATRHFVDRYLDHCIRQDALHAAAFLSLGTEAIVGRMYEILLVGLQKAGVDERHLGFFKLHIACDDEHAQTLEDILLSFAGDPNWERASRRALDAALSLRRDFFRETWLELRRRRVDGHIDRIQARRSLLTDDVRDSQLKFQPHEPSDTTIYRNQIEAMNIDFTVERAPFPAEVIDARVVRIPPGKANERHRHAHETVFYILQGSGRVMVGDRWIEVAPGDSVFVPRWAMHQSQNKGDTEMAILAITDFYLTGKAFLGDYDSTARMKRSAGHEG